MRAPQLFLEFSYSFLENETFRRRLPVQGKYDSIVHGAKRDAAVR